MTRDTFKAILDPLVIALRADFDLPTWTTYFRALKDVQEGLLAAAIVRRLERARRDYEPVFPEPGTLREWAEDARIALIAAHPYDGCAECEGSIGFRPRLDQRNTVERCPCRQRHAEKLARLGVGAPLALPAGREPGEDA